MHSRGVRIPPIKNKFCNPEPNTLENINTIYPKCHELLTNHICCNLNLGFVTKAMAYKGAGQE